MTSRPTCCAVIGWTAFFIASVASIAFVAYYLPPIIAMIVECSAGGCQ